MAFEIVANLPLKGYEKDYDEQNREGAKPALRLRVQCEFVALTISQETFLQYLSWNAPCAVSLWSSLFVLASRSRLASASRKSRNDSPSPEFFAYSYALVLLDDEHFGNS